MRMEYMQGSFSSFLAERLKTFRENKEKILPQIKKEAEEHIKTMRMSYPEKQRMRIDELEQREAVRQADVELRKAEAQVITSEAEALSRKTIVTGGIIAGSVLLIFLLRKKS